MSDFKPGLEGVIAFETEIAEPDKEGGSLRYRGVDIEELVRHVSYGHVWGLLVDNAFSPPSSPMAASGPACPTPRPRRNGRPPSLTRFRSIPATSGSTCRAPWP